MGQSSGVLVPEFLVMNCHEAWIYQLDGLGIPFDIVVDLPGRARLGWDNRMRPFPREARPITLKEALAASQSYQVAVAHNLTDLFDLSPLQLPKLLILHSTLEGRILEQGGAMSLEEMQEQTRTYLELTRTEVLAVSELKRKSWNLPAELMGFGVQLRDYPQGKLEVAQGIRVSNLFNQRRRILLADFHERAFGGLPLEFVGENPDMPGVTAATDWEDLKTRLGRSRFFVHTADPRLEDGYNMATVEAMASGLPVLGNCHPSSPIVHGKQGFLSDDPRELRGFAERLLRDQDLALKMGAEARALAEQLFPIEALRTKFRRALARAKARYQGQILMTAHPQKKRRRGR